MRIVCALMLCAAAVSAQGKKKRTVAAILTDYANALGDVQQVNALHATGSLGGDLGMSVYYKDGKCVRTLRGRGGRTEWVNDRGVFISYGGFFERFRIGLPSQRSMYYAQKLVANPFPLLPFVRNKVAAAGLNPGVATMFSGKGRNRKKVRFEVLGTAIDRNGVSTQYIVHPQTHYLTLVLFKQGVKTIAAVRYWQHKKVQGVLLPGGVELFTPFLLENEKVKKGPVTGNARRVDQYLKWTVNPNLRGVSFDVPGVSTKDAKGFLRVELATGPDPAELAVGDIDVDGKRDIVVACHGGVWVHFGGALRKPVKVALGEWSHRGLVIEDMDRDGRPEIITTSRLLPAEMFFVVSFDANRKPQVIKHLGAPFLGNGMACADLDMDGLGDLVTSGWADGRLDIKFGNGQRGFRVAGLRPLANRKSRNPRCFGVAIGRLNTDRLQDIVVADGTRVLTFLGQLNGALLPGPPIRAGPRPVDVCFADVNADSNPDLLVANDSGGGAGDLRGDIAVILSTGAGKWKFHAKFEAGVRTPAVRAGHFNADGHIDLVAASFLTGEVRVLYGDGKGGFKPGVRLRSGRGTYRLHVTDFDGDGADDILATNRLDDTVTILLNRTGAPARPRQAPPPRARECEAVVVPFKLEGLTARYEFAGEFRIPADIRDPSGLAFQGGAASYRQLVLVSDKEPSIFRITLDVGRKRLLVGPRIPLAGTAGRLDLEGVAFDGTGNLFLACEADSSVLRVSLLGHVMGRVPTGIVAGKNDGIEGLALRRRKDGTPLLYVFRERMGKTLKQPAVHVYGLEEDPFSLEKRLVTRIPFATPDQTGATVSGERMYVVGRLRREIFEFGFDGRGFASTPKKSASFKKLTDNLLGLNSVFGVVEAIAIDAWGDLYLLIDNNGQVMGKAGLNRGNEGRLLWFRALDRPKAPLIPRQVMVKHIYIPWAGARGNPSVKRTRAEADKLSESIARKLRGGADFDALARKHHHRQPRFPERMTIKLPQARPGRGEFNRDKLPRAFARLAFALKVGEVGVAEFHRIECPFGFHVLMRMR